jgi:hypothetical protein
MERILLVFILCALLSFGCHYQPAHGGLILEREAARLTKDISRQAGLAGRQVVVTPHSFYDASTGMSLPLALHLKSAVVAALIKEGATVLAPGPDLQDSLHLRGSWLKDKTDISLSLEAFRMGDKGIEIIAA